jgi:glycosyltransferase involved in cell wall biosynthesis
MRVIAVLATYNEASYLDACVSHLNANGVEVYLLDNESTDGTPDLARRYLGHGVIDIDTFPRAGHFALREQLRRKEELYATLKADWFMHVDADEIHVARPMEMTLAEAYAKVEAEGYNAVNFMEYTFIPVREHPDHEPAHFRETMRWYYPFLPSFPHRLNAWKKTDARAELEWSGGHVVRFPGLKMWPTSFVMRHYLFMSTEHARRKYEGKRYAPDELRDGWFGGESAWRNRFTTRTLQFPSKNELREFVNDNLLDASNPRTAHFLDVTMQAPA